MTRDGHGIPEKDHHPAEEVPRPPAHGGRPPDLQRDLEQDHLHRRHSVVTRHQAPGAFVTSWNMEWYTVLPRLNRQDQDKPKIHFFDFDGLLLKPDKFAPDSRQ